MFILVYRINKHNTELDRGSIGRVQTKRTELKRLSTYNNGKLIIRSKQGLKNNPNWEGKITD